MRVQFVFNMLNMICHVAGVAGGNLEASALAASDRLTSRHLLTPSCLLHVIFKVAELVKSFGLLGDSQ